VALGHCGAEIAGRKCSSGSVMALQPAGRHHPRAIETSDPLRAYLPAFFWNASMRLMAE
jgi:hypothetical protein